MIDFLKVLFLIVNPLMMAFIASVLVGVFFKDSAVILFIKRVVTLCVYAFSLMLYFYLAYIVGGAALYIAMFAPVGIALLFIIASLIFAPKDKIKEQSEKDFKMTGWDSMFPNDIDNKP